MVKTQKNKTDVLMKNRLKVERVVEKERLRREEERGKEEMAILEYNKVLEKHIGGMNELWKQQR
jgi:hypothetical protein